LIVQGERASYTERQGWVICQAKGLGYWFHESALHSVKICWWRSYRSSVDLLPFSFIHSSFVMDMATYTIWSCMLNMICYFMKIIWLNYAFILPCHGISWFLLFAFIYIYIYSSIPSVIQIVGLIKTPNF
jgi:hypothetical protein